MSTSSPLSDTQYHSLAMAVLSAVETQVDRWLDADVIDIDTHRSGGLLELAFPNSSKVIINMQPPLQELWLATRGGGFHFRYTDGTWQDTRDGTEFFACLSAHVSKQAGKTLVFVA
jgi:CyaY protein